MVIDVVVAGPRGRMGTEAIQMIKSRDNLRLVACIDRKNDGKSLKDIHPTHDLDVPIYTDPDDCFAKEKPDVLLELTVPSSWFKNAKSALLHKVPTVVGSSGLDHDLLEQLEKLSNEHKVGCIVAPNFAIGAILMMKFSKMAAKYLPHVEIVEKHHDQKIDSPSGSLLKTVELIHETREKVKQGHPEEYETVQGARGGDMDGVKVHSIRLPGLMAHQEVMFGSEGQMLTIKHESFHRGSFMEGIYLSMTKAIETKGFIYGLENIID